jgi:hypothetical protein
MGTLGDVAKGVARLHGGTPSPIGCLAARRIRLDFQRERAQPESVYEHCETHALLHEKTYRKFPCANFLGQSEDLTVPHVFPLAKIERMAPMREMGEIVGEASQYWLSHQTCHPRTTLPAEDQPWTVMREHQ